MWCFWNIFLFLLSAVPCDSGADLKLCFKAVYGCRHGPGHSIRQSCWHNKCPPSTEAWCFFRELNGDPAALPDIKHLQEYKQEDLTDHLLRRHFNRCVNVKHNGNDHTKLCFHEDTSSPMLSTGLRMMWCKNSSQSTVIELSLSILMLPKTTTLVKFQEIKLSHPVLTSHHLSIFKTASWVIIIYNSEIQQVQVSQVVSPYWGILLTIRLIWQPKIITIMP